MQCLVGIYIKVVFDKKTKVKTDHFFQPATLVEQVATTFGQAYFVYKIHDNRFVYLTSALADLVGISIESALQNALQFLEFLYPEDKEFMFDQYARLLDSKTQKGIEFRIQVPGHDIQWLCLCCQLFEQEEGNYIAGYVEDITKHKEYQHNILKFNAKKNSTLEILSHDLAAPFSNIEGMVELLENEVQPCGEVATQLLAFIKQNAKKGSDIIRDFIDNEFLESSQVVLHKERVDICDRIGMMMENYQKMGGNLLSKKFVLQLPPESIYVYLDVMKFMQAINNLISNAIKFTYDTGTIIVKVEEQVGKVVITVADNGIGIPDDLKSQLFDKFTKSRREGVRGEKSVGLGMSIIKNIVELHQGHVWFESEENKGSTFFVEVPRDNPF